MNPSTDKPKDHRASRTGPDDAARALRPALRELLDAYRSSGSITRRKMLISQLCLELRARDAQKEEMFYGGVLEVLSAAERSRASA